MLMTANELTTGVAGIFNRNDLRSSPPGDVKTYYLTEAERKQIIDKYGPYSTNRRKNKATIRKAMEPELTKEQYLAFKRDGLSDKKILDRRIPGLEAAKLTRLKIRWGLIK